MISRICYTVEEKMSLGDLLSALCEKVWAINNISQQIKTSC